MNLPKNPHERRVMIIAELRLRGTSLSAIARQEGVAVASVSKALLYPSSHIEAAIADALDTTPQALFPDRFDLNGERLGVLREKHRSMKKTAESCPNCKAA